MYTRDKIATVTQGQELDFLINGISFEKSRHWQMFRGTQRQFSENICSEDDSRSKIFGAFASASPRIFQLLKNGIIAHF